MIVRGRRSRCGITPMGDNRNRGRWRTRLAGRTIQWPAFTMSAISSRKNWAYPFADLWQPRLRACSRRWCDQGAVCWRTGAPTLRRRFRYGPAGCGMVWTLDWIQLCPRCSTHSASKPICNKRASLVRINLPKASSVRPARCRIRAVSGVDGPTDLDGPVSRRCCVREMGLETSVGHPRQALSPKKAFSWLASSVVSTRWVARRWQSSKQKPFL